MSKESLSDIWKLKKRGKRDADRHKELIEKAIRKHGKDLITEYNIIKSDGNKKIKVPIKFLEKYRVKYGKLKDEDGVGQGGQNAKPGDKYQIGNGDQKASGNEPGQEEGERTYDAEITVDELLTILLSELNLPWLDTKNSSHIESETEELESISKKGSMPNIHLKKTLIENIKRQAAKGSPKIGKFSKEDLRYKDWETKVEYHSNAVVYLLLDRSGSMDKDKTHIAKSFYFWMVQFLKRKYKNVELVFIAHDTKAFLVSEDEFFKISANGGTACSSAFKLAYEHMLEYYPSDSHNIYLMEFSDGDNFTSDNHICYEYIEKMLPLVKAMGYGEVGASGYMFSGETLARFLNDKIKRTKFVSLSFKNKEDIYVGLKKFFNIDGISDKSKR